MINRHYNLFQEVSGSGSDGCPWLALGCHSVIAATRHRAKPPAFSPPFGQRALFRILPLTLELLLIAPSPCPEASYLGTKPSVVYNLVAQVTLCCLQCDLP